jgi:hypothetical protein
MWLHNVFKTIKTKGNDMENSETTPPNNTLAIKFSDNAVDEMRQQRKQFELFVKSQLHDKVDFGVLPGTDKPALWKSGAEKLANLFQLGSRIVHNEKTIDIEKNFAMFAITIEIFHLPTGRSVAQCEGICNSQEKKYRERQNYKWVKENGRNVKIPDGPPAPTPIGDVMNTLTKMAQKRAYVGAVIVATKASDFFNHDLTEDEEVFYENNPDYLKNQQELADSERKKAQEQQAIKEKERAAKMEEKKAEENKPQPVDERKILGTFINNERVRLGWNLEQVKKFISENFNKASNELTITEMQLLVKAMEKIEVKK